MINHRYSIVEKLGEGGAGEVFLAEDTLHGHVPVALKALWPPGHPGAVDEAQFLSEVSLLLRLIHPNVIRIYDFGLIRKADEAALRNRRYYTMEFLVGTDSFEWCSRVTDPTQKSALLESLLAQSLSVLSYIHNEGVIHFDIKPQNLMLIPPREGAEFPTLKLTDFGFSKQVEKGGELPLRGTVEYAAPELLRGDAADHRIDLYSLGATFFHLLEGHCPFEASEPVELIKLALTGESRFVQGKSPEFATVSNVISTLLRKEPSDRFPTARDAARPLLAKKPDLWRQYFGFSVKPRFVGRREEREMLIRSLSGLRSGEKPSKASAVVVCGQEGIGKTALLQEMTRLGRSEGLAVYELSTAQREVPFSAIDPLMEMLQAQVRSFSGEGERLVGRYRSVLSIGEGWVREKDVVIELRGRFIADCALVFPFMVIVDDLQFMDEFSLQVVQGAVQGASPGRFLLLAAEPGETACTLQAPRAVQLRLGELGKDDVNEMGRTLFGAGAVGDALGPKLFEMFGGVPEMIVEALRTVADRLPEEALNDDKAAHAFLEALESHLPLNLDDLVIRKIDRLVRERKDILSVLACFSGPARVKVLPSLVSQPRERVTEHLAMLELDGYLESVSGGERVRLRAKRLQAALLSSLGAEASRFRRMIATEMERRQELASFEDLEELAFQFREIGERGKASQYSEAAADEAVKLLAFRRGAQLYEAAAEAAAEGPRLFDVRSKLTESYFLAGEYQQTIITGSDLLQQEKPRIEPAESEDKTRGRLLKAVGRAQSELGEYDAAKRHMTAAIEHVQSETERAELRQELVGVDISLGDYVEAERTCKSQIELAKKFDNGRLLAAAFTDLGIAEFYQGKFDAAVTSFNESMHVYTRMNQSARLIGVMTNLGNVMSAKGDFDLAVENWTSALRTAREYGTLNQQARILNNLGIAHFNLKAYDKAKEFYGQARQLFERINSKSGLAYTLTNFGEVYLAEGEYEAALSCWTDARELYASMDDLHGLTETYLQLAQVYLIVGDLESTGRALTEAERMIAEKNLDLFLGTLQQMKGQCLMAERSWDAAVDSLSEAAHWFEEADQAEKKWVVRVNIARCHFEERRYKNSQEILTTILQSDEARRNAQIEAETLFLLGDVAKVAPSLVDDKPLNYYKRGMERIEQEPVTELTWKIAFALAREYQERGLAGRSREYLEKAKAVLEYFLSNFSSNDLRDQYLFVGQKNRVLTTIDILTKT